MIGIVTILSMGEPIYEEFTNDVWAKLQQYKKIVKIRNYGDLSLDFRETVNAEEVNKTLPLNYNPPREREIVYE